MNRSNTESGLFFSVTLGDAEFWVHERLCGAEPLPCPCLLTCDLISPEK